MSDAAPHGRSSQAEKKGGVGVMKKQIFELSRHGEDLRIHIENMSKLDVMTSLSNFLEGLVDRKILDEEDILMCLLAGTDAKKMTDAVVKVLQRLCSEEMKEGIRGDKRFS